MFVCAPAEIAQFKKVQGPNALMHASNGCTSKHSASRQGNVYFQSKHALMLKYFQSNEVQG